MRTSCVVSCFILLVPHLPASVASAQTSTPTVRPAPNIAAPLNPAFPRGRELPAFVYDSLGDRLLVYGGSIRGRDSRTFAWQHDAWRVLSDSGPYYRDDMAFASMGSSGALVFFGGNSELRGPDGRYTPQLFRETWRLDGSQWTRVDTLGPEARKHQVGAYDAARKRFVVFGGTIGLRQRGEPPQTIANDTWEWDGTRWERLRADGPPGRLGFSMAYDATSRLVILHGGVRDGVALTDTWGWDGVRWRQLSTDGPRSIYGAAATAPLTGVVLFGGHRMNDSSSAATYHWDGRSWKIVAETGPSARTFNALATDTRRKRVYLIGGGDDFWYLTSDFKWVRVPVDE